MLKRRNNLVIICLLFYCCTNNAEIKKEDHVVNNETMTSLNVADLDSLCLLFYKESLIYSPNDAGENNILSDSSKTIFPLMINDSIRLKNTNYILGLIYFLQKHQIVLLLNDAQENLLTKKKDSITQHFILDAFYFYTKIKKQKLKYYPNIRSYRVLNFDGSFGTEVITTGYIIDAFNSIDSLKNDLTFIKFKDSINVLESIDH